MRVESITFLGEQQGAPEFELQQKFSEYFKSQPSISCAFLMRVAYGDSVNQNVALCIHGDNLDQKVIVEYVGEIFHETFNKDQALDIIFVNSDQVKQALMIGRPFYRIAPRT